MILATTKVEDFDRFLESSPPRAQRSERARIQGLDGLPRSERRGPRLGALRLGRAGLAELRVRSRGPADPQRSRARGQAASGALAGTLPARRPTMATSAGSRPARVGIITDQTGPLSFMGIANANVAKMVVDDINADGGLLGHPIELFIEDSATEDARPKPRRPSSSNRSRSTSSSAASTARPARPSRARRSSRATRCTSTRSSTRGRSADPLIFCTGPVPAQQVEPLFPVADATHRGEDVLHAVRRLHLAAHDEQEGP